MLGERENLVNFLAVAIAFAVAVYTLSYANHVWRREHNLMGAAAVVFLALADLALPFYLLYFHH